MATNKTFTMPEDIIDNVIPLDKLIMRLKTDLQLSDAYANKWNKPANYRIIAKNRTKMSLIYYLELLQDLI